MNKQSLSYKQWRSLKQWDYNQAPTQLFVKTRPHWTTADKPCVCVQPISSFCSLLMCVFNLPRLKVHWLQSLVCFWEDGKLQWLDQFGQGVWCAWESSRDFSKILGLLAGRRFLRGPIILQWVEFKSRRPEFLLCLRRSSHLSNMTLIVVAR